MSGKRDMLPLHETDTIAVHTLHLETVQLGINKTPTTALGSVRDLLFVGLSKCLAWHPLFLLIAPPPTFALTGWLL